MAKVELSLRNGDSTVPYPHCVTVNGSDGFTKKRLLSNHELVELRNECNRALGLPPATVADASGIEMNENVIDALAEASTFSPLKDYLMERGVTLT